MNGLFKSVSFLILLLLPFPLFATTRNAASCSSTDVNTQITASSTGDTVHIPTGATCYWAAGAVSLNKAITIEGNGEANTSIDISGTPGSATFTITKQSSGLTWIKNMTILTSSNKNALHPLIIDGLWTARAVIFSHVTFTNCFATTIDAHTTGGLIFSYITFNACDFDDFLITVKDLFSGAASWTTNDSLGTHDTTGELNMYIEDSTFNGGVNGIVDCDDKCRLVMRYNHFFNSGGYNSHGWDTSPEGARHYEIYGNDFHYTNSVPAACGALDNLNWYIWIRGGTGVIFDNTFEDITSGGCGNKLEIIFSDRAIQDMVGGGVAPFANCGALAYPVPHGAGVNYTGGVQVVDPIYLWGNTGTYAAWHDDFGWGNPCGVSYDTYFLAGRDWDSATRPSYTAYTYPHPLVDGGSSPSITSLAPATGVQGATSLSVAVVGSSTNFVNATTVCDFGSNITVNSCTVSSATALTANITIAGVAAAGARDATFTTGAETATSINGFTVTALATSPIFNPRMLRN